MGTKLRPSGYLWLMDGDRLGSGREVEPYQVRRAWIVAGLIAMFGVAAFLAFAAVYVRVSG